MGLDLRCREMVIEGDSLTVVRKVNSTDDNMSVTRAYIEDIKALKKGGDESYLVGEALEFSVVEEERDKRKVDPLDLQRSRIRSK
ncbi:hypothetical protein Gotur_010794, partial [Gossypium turneri]